MDARYRVVIVDDEPIITDGLSSALNWGEFGCEVAGKAYSGQEGLNVIREIKPDILFTDIRMPGMDGLQMVAALKSEFPEMKITILTGYRDFDYAQEAIRLGVFRYLVKPSRMKELHDAIADMVAALDAERAAKKEPEKTKEPEETQEDEDVGQAGNYIVNCALSYIRAHYSEKLSLGDVASLEASCGHRPQFLRGGEQCPRRGGQETDAGSEVSPGGHRGRGRLFGQRAVLARLQEDDRHLAQRIPEPLPCRAGKGR